VNLNLHLGSGCYDVHSPDISMARIDIGSDIFLPFSYLILILTYQFILTSVIETALHLRETGSGGMDYIDLAQDWSHWRALVKTAMNIRVP
jgi:hypothetical protein